jgi:DNA-binding NarL/FixJ family response regulator
MSPDNQDKPALSSPSASNEQPPCERRETELDVAAAAAAATTNPVRVLVVDDHAIWREGVRSMLVATEFQIVGMAGSGTEATALAPEIDPRIVLLDIRMAGGDGFETLAALKKQNPRMAVVMLTTYENPTYIARAIAGGASGYLLKGIERRELLSALRAVASGETLLKPEDFVHTLRSVRDSEEALRRSGSSSNGKKAALAVFQPEEAYEPLTRREEEVLRLVTTGLSNREIGSLLFISEGTVKSHVAHIIGKLGVSDRVQAAVWAVRNGLVELTTP